MSSSTQTNLNPRFRYDGLNEEQAFIRALGNAIASTDDNVLTYRDVFHAVQAEDAYDGTLTHSQTFANVERQAIKLGIVWTLEDDDAMTLTVRY